MKTIKFVRLGKQSIEAFASVTLFNQQCVYPVINETEEDVMLEIHPASGVGHSSKLVAPKSMVEKQSTSLMDLMPAGHYRFSPQFLESKEISETQFNSRLLKDKDCMPLVNPVTGMHDTNAVIVATIPRIDGNGTANVYAPPNWFIEQEPVKMETDSPAKKGKKVKLVSNDDLGKMVRIVATDMIDAPVGSRWCLYSWDKYRGRFVLYNGSKEVRCAPEAVELVPEKDKPKAGILVTQGANWLKNGKTTSNQRVGSGIDDKPFLMRLESVDSFSMCKLSVISAPGVALYSLSTPFDDVRVLTEEELAALALFVKAGSRRDEGWCRKFMRPSLVKAIDISPASPFVSGMLQAWYEIHVPAQLTTKEQVWELIVKHAEKINVDSANEMVFLSAFNTTPAAPAPAPVVEPVPTPEVGAGLPVASAVEQYHENPAYDEGDPTNQ